VTQYAAYRDSFPNARLIRSQTGVLEVALHTDGGTLVFNGHTHEQFVDLFHTIGSDLDNRVVILTGAGHAFMESISPEGFDFFSPLGYDKIYREGRKVLMNILDVEVPLIAAVARGDRQRARSVFSSHSTGAGCRNRKGVGCGQ
jgi:enoyl-CoA hydratase/carnithine racemase